MPKDLSTPKILVILGPTASGKSELAVKIAKKFNGEIISADSRQVYKGLDIGSGKIPRDKMSNIRCQLSNVHCYKGVPHHLLDVASPKRTFTVSQYQKLAKKALTDIIKRGELPIICGGTGLYIDALIYAHKFPQVPPQPKLRKKLEKKTTEELFRELQKLDPRRAENIDKHNRRRLIRALEIVIKTGRPILPLKFAWLHGPSGVEPQTPTHFASPNGERTLSAYLKIGIKKSPTELKHLIKKRLMTRLKQGMIEEVKKIHQQGVSWQGLDDLGLEYRYVSRYLRGLLSKKMMIEMLEKEIYRYAKRQMTWFKRDEQIRWIENKKEAFGLAKRFLLN